MTQAKARVLVAMALYRVEHSIVGRDMLEVTEPGDPAWQWWQEHAKDMDGDPKTAVLAVRAGAYGAWFASVKEALSILPA